VKKRIIAERYASALLAVAKKGGETERVLDEMLFLKRLLVENPALKRFLESPHITQEDKVNLIRKSLSPVLTRTSINFLLLLGKKYRLSYLSEIVEEYQRLYDTEMAIQRTDVITVYPLDDTATEALRNRIERLMKKDVKLCCYVDHRILGGVIIKTPNLIIDGSIRRQLRDLSQAMAALKV